MSIRLGDVLVQRGTINEQQRSEILSFQKLHHRPFGLLAEQLFGVSPSAVENAWAEQYAALAPRLIPAEIRPEADAIAAVEARQAWQFGLLPIRFDGDELVCATTTDRLAKAMRFAGWRVDTPCRFAICEEDALCLALTSTYGDSGFAPAFQQNIKFA
ncbi:MAG: hypothetical protein AAF235_01765 [Planctomycetota bacterium]